MSRRICSVLVLVLLITLVQAVPGTSPTSGDQALAADPVIAAAGDIACDPADPNFNGGLGTSSKCRQKYTSDLLVGGGLAAVLPLGDTQYNCGGASAYTQSYDPSWGRVKDISRPVNGDEEYATSGGTGCGANGAGYFNYFGAAAGEPSKGYYSFDIGSWHLIALNSNCSEVACKAGSTQEKWLKADLAANPGKCTLAYFHQPRFSSQLSTPSSSKLAFWQDLYAAGADVVLNAHYHYYERFAPQDPSGAADPTGGIRQFSVGTGGRSLITPKSTPAPNSEVRSKTFGVLKLTLHSGSYDWQFVPEAGKTFTDSGSASCHSVPVDDPPNAALSVTPSSGDAPLAVTADASASTDTDATPIDTYRFDFGEGTVVGPQAQATADHTYNAAGTYTVTVTVTDTGGKSSEASAQVTVTTTAPNNLVGNPGFETNTTGWKTPAASITLERVAGGHSGDWAAKLTNTGAAGANCEITDAPNWVTQTTAGTYTSSIWARADSAGATLKLRVREYSGGALAGSVSKSLTLSTSWQEVTANYTVANPGSFLDYEAFIASAPTGVCFYADDASIVRT
jgi:PKD repeat protein